MAAGGDQAVSGLEGHLRNLILTNSTGDESPPTGPRVSVSPQIGSGVAGAATSENSSLQSSKATKRRPNQAERRKMNSELSIPIEPQQQPAYPSQSRYGSAGNDSRNRHQYGENNSYSRGMDGGRGSAHYPSSSWNQRNSRGYTANSPSTHAGRGNRGLYDHRQPQFGPEEIAAQSAMLDALCWPVLRDSEIDRDEIGQKEAFRQRLENISREAIARYEEEQAALQGFPSQSVELKCFGSLSSGFATKASDMDLGLLSPLSRVQPDASGSPIPRILEKALLDAGLGARLLSRTRVPIIKLCENPPESLRQGLLAERERWEKGIDDEQDDFEDDQIETAGSHDQNSGQQAKLAPTESIPTSVAESVSASTPADSVRSLLYFDIPNGDNGDTRRFHLRQGQSSTMTRYHALAKWLLRKVGGRDATASNQWQFSDEDWALLNRVCEAFVAGLADARLRQRLAQYPSLSFRPTYGMPNNRSLIGVLIQIEGEQILQTWENWPARAVFDTHQYQLEQALSSWQRVQGDPSFGLDPMAYTNELQVALDKLKRVPSIQLISLEQAQYETPKQYHARARGLIDQFKASQEAAIDRYIAGIYHHEVREAVKAAVEGWPGPPELEAVVTLHKSVHLVRELKRAVEKGLYRDAQADDIREYLKLLQSPLRKVAKSDGSGAFVIPVPEQQMALLGRVRELPDPHHMAPNQPRDRYRDGLEFPKTGAGVQCDINFSAHLALQNTLLLRCYAHTDPRVRPMVLFVKHWAKVRGINSGYRGTLSSYGYVLMVLHYLVNVAQPFVCPNLQQLAPPPPPNLSPAEIEATITCKGYNIQFWRNEQEILQFAHANQLNHNRDSIGHLLRGFFEYYAQTGMTSNSVRGFEWGRDVLSLRTRGGLVKKQSKGWTGAKTVFESQGAGVGAVHNPQTAPASQQQNARRRLSVTADGQVKPMQVGPKEGDVKEVRHRYLFAIEDPFEIDHNVARTVTHNGIVSIRDEFRRAWRIIGSVGSEAPQQDLLEDAIEGRDSAGGWASLLFELHGPQGIGSSNA